MACIYSYFLLGFMYRNLICRSKLSLHLGTTLTPTITHSVIGKEFNQIIATISLSQRKSS